MSVVQDRVAELERKMIEIARQQSALPMRIAGSMPVVIQENIFVGIAIDDISPSERRLCSDGQTREVLGHGYVQPYDADKVYYNETGTLRIKCPDADDREIWFQTSRKRIAAGTGVMAAMWQGFPVIIVELCDPIDPYCEGV